MNSYARRLRDIEFLKQRGEDLEAICETLARELGRHGGSIPLVARPIDGDRYLNDLPDFQMRLCSICHEAKMKAARGNPFDTLPDDFET